MAKYLCFDQDWQGNIHFLELGLKFRVLTPKDFYQIEYFELNPCDILGLLCDNQDVYNSLPLRIYFKLYTILERELLYGRIYGVKDWLDSAFYLLGKKWDSNLDWLESQPIDKVIVMIEILNKSQSLADGIDMLE